MASLLKWLATNAISWDIGWHSILRTRASRSSPKPSFMMVQQDRSSLLQPDHLSQITTMGLEPRVQLAVAGRSENFLVGTVANYSVLTSYSGSFSSQTCNILGATGKTITKIFIHPSTSLVAGMDKYLPISFRWSLRVQLPYWEEIFPCLRNLAAIADLIEGALKLSSGDILTLFLPSTK